MAYAVTHVLVVIVILDLFRHYVFGKKKFPRYLLVIGGIAGLLPDIDIPLGWILSFFKGEMINIHGTFLHSLTFVLLFVLLGVFLHYKNNKKWAKISYVIAFGWFFHLLLDCTFGSRINWFLWPFSLFPSLCPQWDIYPFASSIDAIILVLWLVHAEVNKKIRDYI